jgi:hypothetical protein
MIFYIAATVLFFTAGKKLERLDELFAAGKGLLFGLLIVLAFLFFPFEKYNPGPLVGSYPHLAYGLILFSLTGFSIIPELHPDKQYRKTIWIAQFLIVLLYVVFAVALSPYVFGDSFKFKDPALGVFVNLTGFISVFTTYLLLSMITKDVYKEDIKMNDKGALGFTAVVPFIVTNGRYISGKYWFINLFYASDDLS